MPTSAEVATVANLKRRVALVSVTTHEAPRSSAASEAIGRVAGLREAAAIIEDRCNCSRTREVAHELLREANTIEGAVVACEKKR